MRGEKNIFLVLNVVLLLSLMPLASAGFFDFLTGTGNVVSDVATDNDFMENSDFGIIKFTKSMSMEDSENIRSGISDVMFDSMDLSVKYMLTAEYEVEGAVQDESVYVNLVKFHSEASPSFGEFESLNEVMSVNYDGTDYDSFPKGSDKKVFTGWRGSYHYNSWVSGDVFISIWMEDIDLANEDYGEMLMKYLEKYPTTLVEEVIEEDIYDEFPQCEETLKDTIFVCDKGEFIGVSLEVIDRSDNFIQIGAQEQFEEIISDRLVEGDTWNVKEVSGQEWVITLSNIGVDGDESKVRLHMEHFVEEVIEEDIYDEFPQCEETLKDTIFICEKGEFVGVSLEVIERSDNFIQISAQGQFEESISDRLSQGDTWNVKEVSGQEWVITLSNIGVDGDESKVRLHMEHFVEEVIEEDIVLKQDFSCPENCVLVDGKYVPLITSFTPGLEIPDYFLSDNIQFGHVIYDTWKDYAPMNEKVQELISGVDSDIEKARKILNWVKHSKEYCEECLSMANERRGQGMEDKYLYPELFEYEYGVCLDATIIAVAMLRSIGIPTSYSIVDMNHIVTLFYVDGFWYGADPTFSPSEIVLTSFEEGNRMFYYFGMNEDVASDEASFYFDDPPIVRTFEYFTEEFSEIYIPGKNILNGEGDFQYQCIFSIQMRCDSFGCFYSDDKKYLRSVDYSAKYDVGRNTPYAHPFYGPYSYFRAPAEVMYRFECTERDFVDEHEVIASLEFIPSVDEVFVLKPSDLIMTEGANVDYYNELIGLLSKDLYLEEVLQVLSGEKIANKNVESSRSKVMEDSKLESVSCGSGCLVDDKCLPYGFRKSGDFCSTDNEMIEQQIEETGCENNFQCISNLCVDSSCVEAGLWKKIMDWFGSIFG